MSALMKLMGRGAAHIRQRDHLFPRALHQLLQALPGRHFRADQGDLEPRQPHRRLPALRRGHQGGPHRMPHRRRRPQSLSRLRGADRRGPRRHRGEDGARSRSRATPISGEAARDPQDPARGDRAAGQVEDAAARRSAKRHRALCAHRRSGSSSNMTGGSPTGSCSAGSSGIRVGRAGAICKADGREVQGHGSRANPGRSRSTSGRGRLKSVVASRSLVRFHEGNADHSPRSGPYRANMPRLGGFCREEVWA